MKKMLIHSQNLTIFILLLCLTNICCGENVKKSVSDEIRDDIGDTNEDSKDELEIPSESESNNVTCTRRQNSNMHPIQQAAENQFPFMAALMSQLDEYLCSGAVVSNGLILTTASCTSQSISYALLNTLKAKKEKDTIMLHVIKTEKFPTFTGVESLKDVGLVYTEKHNGTVASKIMVSNYTSGRNLVDLEALGYGLNSEVSQTKELQYVGLENRSPLEIGNIVKAYIDCIDTKVVTCFKDSGGPAIFDNELIGIVTKGQDECTREMSSAYAINKRMVTVLPTYSFKAWLDERIKKNEVQAPVFLTYYPSKPTGRKNLLSLSSQSSATTRVIASVSYICVAIYAPLFY